MIRASGIEPSKWRTNLQKKGRLQQHPSRTHRRHRAAGLPSQNNVASLLNAIARGTSIAQCANCCNIPIGSYSVTLAARRRAAASAQSVAGPDPNPRIDRLIHTWYYDRGVPGYCPGSVDRMANTTAGSATFRKEQSALRITQRAIEPFKIRRRVSSACPES